MKKAILTTTMLVAGALGLMAQGVVNFDNSWWNFDDSIEMGGTKDYAIYAAPGVPVSAATGWSAQLWELPDTWNGLQNPTNLHTDRISFNPDFPGYILGKEVGPLKVPIGTNTLLAVRIFDAAGSQLAEGPSFVYAHKLSTPPGALDTLMVNFKSFVVPEPSTVALGVLGLGALLLFRRRK